MKRRYAPVADRLWQRVDKSGGPGSCWPWTGSGTAAHGGGLYGHIKDGATVHITHRLAYELSVGPIPAGMLVCHRCDNPPCCNPAHLFLGTAADNARDRDTKGRRVNPHPFGRGEHNPNSKLAQEDVDEIRFLLSRGISHAAIARRYPVHRQTITKIANGTRWALVGEVA